MKQILGLIQSSTLPPLKGIDAFCIHNTCEWVFDLCNEFEKQPTANETKTIEKKEEVISEVLTPIEKPIEKKLKRKHQKLVLLNQTYVL